MPEDKTPLSDAEISASLANLPGWERDGIYLQKTFVFENFAQINAFLPAMAQLIVDQNHHPDMTFLPGKKSAFYKMTTHSHGGLTQADLDLAGALNDLVKQ